MWNWNAILSHPMTHLYVIFAVSVLTATWIAITQPRSSQ